MGVQLLEGRRKILHHLRIFCIGLVCIAFMVGVFGAALGLVVALRYVPEGVGLTARS